MSDCCLEPSELPAIQFMAWTSYISMMMMMSTFFVLDQQMNFIALADWNKRPHGHIILISSRLLTETNVHTDTLSWFRANLSLILLLNAAYLAENQQIPIIKCVVWPESISNPRSTVLETNITPRIKLFCREFQFIFVDSSNHFVISFDKLHLHSTFEEPFHE